METCTFSLSFVALFCFGLGLHLPSNFKICHRSAEDFDDCVAIAIEDALVKLENGLEEFKFPPIQPIKVPSLTIGEGTGAVHVIQKYKNVEIYNVPKAKVKKAKVTLTEKEFKLFADVHFDEVKLDADYDFNGQILVLPFVGVGKCTITLTNVTGQLELAGEITKRKEKSYVDLTDVAIKFTPGSGSFNFTNLFNGNERLAKETLSVLNENWKEVFNDIKPGYEEALGAILKNLAGLIIKKVPVEEAFPQ